MKFLRNLSFFLLCSLFFGVTALAADLEIMNPETKQYQWQTVSDVLLTCDGETLETDVPAMLYQERTMVPVRVISEKLGATVDWEEDTQTVVIQKEETEIRLVIHSPVAMVDGETVPLYDNVAPILVCMDGITRTMVPIRFVSEQLGIDVDWDGETYTAILTTNQVPPEPVATGTVGLPTVDGNLVTIPYTGEVTTKILLLEERLVVDLGGGLLGEDDFGTIQVGKHGLTTIRYNQYDTAMEGFSRVARLVLDLEVHPEDCQVETIDHAVIITLPEDIVEEPEQPEQPEEEEEPEESTGPVVVLDAGHGGSEVSAIHFGVDEKTLTLPVTLGVGAILEEAGVTVHYTRTEDVKVTLSQRAALANEVKADIFVSIHFNAFTPKPEVNGIETFHIYDGENSKILANYVHKAVLASTGAYDRKVKEAGYYVLKNTEMPAILVEGGFMTNQAELNKLVTPEYQAFLSQGIAEGILEYFGIA